ncbi:unnamed protein product [Microthlaspi erraticum]|uniref:FBD domain-containing protein n=1 Tax=Microthlaspi erraticum TaxID=1685480 RepID=A0A6D2J239_9BRAS|nr:unnamed protein product [Microthlaspi erraticum]
MPKLVEAYVEVRYSDINSFIGSTTSVKRLTICSKTVHSDAFVFNQLEHLKLCVCTSDKSLSLLVRFLKDSPNLRVLDIDVHCGMRWDDPDCVRSSLQAFNWSEYVERRPQERDLSVYIFGQRWSPQGLQQSHMTHV